MSRVIKFRVWEERTKIMTYLGELFCSEHGYHNDKFTTVSFRSISPLHEDLFTIDNEKHQQASRERFKLEQFTGLLDKDGKEIYEGDIIESRWRESPAYQAGEPLMFDDRGCPKDKPLEWRSRIGFVEWGGPGWFVRWWALGTDDRPYKQESQLGWDCWPFTTHIRTVLGNIHENGDLIAKP